MKIHELLLPRCRNCPIRAAKCCLGAEHVHKNSVHKLPCLTSCGTDDVEDVIAKVKAGVKHVGN